MGIGRQAALTGLRDHDTQRANDPEQCGKVQCLNGGLTSFQTSSTNGPWCAPLTSSNITSIEDPTANSSFPTFVNIIGSHPRTIPPFGIGATVFSKIKSPREIFSVVPSIIPNVG